MGRSPFRMRMTVTVLSVTVSMIIGCFLFFIPVTVSITTTSVTVAVTAAATVRMPVRSKYGESDQIDEQAYGSDGDKEDGLFYAFGNSDPLD